MSTQTKEKSRGIRQGVSHWDDVVHAGFIGGTPIWETALEVPGWRNVHGIDVRRAWAVYFLMRGGIERRTKLLEAAGLDGDCEIDFDDMFMAMDNAGEPPSSVVFSGRLGIYCRHCGELMRMLPCGVCAAHRRGQSLACVKPTGGTIHDTVKYQRFGDDRHWESAHDRIANSERQYNGTTDNYF